MSKNPPYVRHRVPIMIDGVLYIGRQHGTGSGAGMCTECAANRDWRLCQIIGRILIDEANENGCNHDLNWHASDSEEDQLFYMKYKLTGGEP